MPMSANSPSLPWSDDEVAFTVASYFDMLMLELSGQRYSKSAMRRDLLPKLDHRSEGAIEFKHCNISAALEELGVPYVRGYKPRRNFQREALFSEVLIQLESRAGLEDAALNAVERPADLPPILDLEKAVVSAPKDEKPRVDDYRPPRISKRDYLAIEARNRALGLAGERFVLRFEQWRLEQAQRHDLAQQVEHVSVTQGDGAGFDILSFTAVGMERHVEVKTTAYGQLAPFYISENERRFSVRNELSYTIARVFSFRDTPRMFWLNGPVERHCDLDPTTFRAKLKVR